MTLLGLLAQAKIDAADLSTPVTPIVALGLAALAIWAWVVWRMRHGRPPLAYEEHRPVPWRGADVAIAFVVLAVVLNLVPLMVLQIWQAAPAANGEIPDDVLAIVFGSQSVSEVGMMLLVIWLFVRRKHADWTDLGFDPRHVGRDLGIGLIGFLSIGAPVTLLYAVLQLLMPEELHPLIELAVRQPSQLWLIGFCAVVVAPLVEEFFFRVILQGWLERLERSDAHEAHVRPAVPVGLLPILISSFVFALVHAGQWPAPVPLFFLALVLGYLYHQTHRLLPSLVVHALLNGTTFLNLWWVVHSGALAGK